METKEVVKKRSEMIEKAHFRGMLYEIGMKLSSEERAALAFIYQLETDGECNILPLLKHLIGQNLVQNCHEDLELLKDKLSKIGHSDITKLVDEYIEKAIKIEPSVQDDVAKCHTGTEEKQSNGTTPHGLIGLTPPAVLGGKLVKDEVEIETRSQGTKRPRTLTEEEKDLEDATGSAGSTEAMMCDTTSEEDSDVCKEEVTQDDHDFMKEANECSSKSPDTETKVGAVIVKESKIIGRGWNRFPTGCEEKFTWVIDRKEEPLEEGKHLYVVYAIRAAIFDAYKNGVNLDGTILYTTLYPSHTCAQCIRDAGIKEVVYISNKFHKTKFHKASKRIMDGIKCRLYSTKD